MRIEIIPLIVGLFSWPSIGLGLVFDAWTPDEIIVKRERRRRRAARAQVGAGKRRIGLGVLGMAAAFVGPRHLAHSPSSRSSPGPLLLVYGVITQPPLPRRDDLEPRMRCAGDRTMSQ